MSYVIHIWNEPTPKTYEEAEEFVFEHPRCSVSDSSVFEELASRLTEKYPCICNEDDQSEDKVWSDGPMDGECDENVYAIGILSQYAEDVLPYIIEKAGELGLTIYDMQLGRAVAPSGNVLLPRDKSATKIAKKHWWKFW